LRATRSHRERGGGEPHQRVSDERAEALIVVVELFLRSSTNGRAGEERTSGLRKHQREQ
jgi:hypothetical protein